MSDMKIYRANGIVFKEKIYREDLYGESKDVLENRTFWIDNGMIMILYYPSAKRWQHYDSDFYTPMYSCIPLDMVKNIIGCSVDAVISTQQFDSWLRSKEQDLIWFDGRRLNHAR